MPTLTLAAPAVPGRVLISIEVRSSLPASLVGSGTKGSKGLVLVLSNSLIATIFIVENENKKLINCLQCHDLWFDIKMHYAKSYRPFQLFANENYKLRNELN